MTTPVGLFGDSRLTYELLPPPQQTPEHQPTPATLPHIKITIGDEVLTLPYLDKKPDPFSLDKKPDPFSDESGVPHDKRSFPLRLNEERTIYLIRNVDLNETAQKIVGYVLLLQELAGFLFSCEERPSEFELSKRIKDCIFEQKTDLKLCGRRYEGRLIPNPEPFQDQFTSQPRPKFVRIPPPIEFLDFAELHNTVDAPHLCFLPHHLGRLRELTSLNLSYQNLNNSREFPKAICELIHLVELFFRGNNFCKLPPEFEKLKELRVLDLAENQNFNHLGSNKDRTIPSPLVVKDFSQLQYLSLAATSFDSLPDMLGLLRRLQGLNISDLRLKEMPEFVLNLPSLQELYAVRNHFRTLPGGLKKLPLSHFNVSGNPIKFFPDELKEDESSFLYQQLSAQGYGDLLKKTIATQIAEANELHQTRIDKLRAEYEAKLNEEKQKHQRQIEELQRAQHKTLEDAASPAPPEPKQKTPRATSPFRGGPPKSSVKKK